MDKGPSLERYKYLLDKMSDIADSEHHDNLIPALVGLLCQVASDSGHDKKTVLSYVAHTLDQEYEEAQQDGNRKH